MIRANKMKKNKPHISDEKLKLVLDKLDAIMHLIDIENIERDTKLADLLNAKKKDLPTYSCINLREKAEAEERFARNNANGERYKIGSFGLEDMLNAEKMD